MAYQPRPPKDLAKVIRIEAIDLPESYEKGEGYYELKFANKPKEVFYHDIISLEKELNTIWKERAQDIINRLQNFHLAYINLDTGEITT